jgi:hypothetical protein
MHYITQRVKNAWRKGRVVSTMFLDVEGAFLNAVLEQLIHNMRMKGILREYTDIIQGLLQGRRMRLKFNDYLLDFFPINNSIGQGDPLSMIMYLFYNAGLVDVPRGKDEDLVAFVDDVGSGSKVDTHEEAHKMLIEMCEREEGAHSWSADHNYPGADVAMF